MPTGKFWDEESKVDGIRLLALDPGDMDTPLHALAIPDADPSTLKRPELAAAEIIEKMLEALPVRARLLAGEHS